MPKIIDNLVKMQVIGLHQDGLTVREISEILDISYGTVRNVLLDVGIYTKAKMGPTSKVKNIDSNKDNVITLYKQGYNVNEINNQLGISKPTIRKILKDAGLFIDERTKGNNRRTKQ